MHQSYTPSDSLLEKYATLVVQFGLRSAEGKKLPKGSVILVNVPEVAKPLAFHLHNAVLKQGYNAILNFTPSNEGKYQFNKSYYELAKKEQLLHSTPRTPKVLLIKLMALFTLLLKLIHTPWQTYKQKKYYPNHFLGKKVSNTANKKLMLGN